MYRISLRDVEKEGRKKMSKNRSKAHATSTWRGDTTHYRACSRREGYEGSGREYDVGERMLSVAGRVGARQQSSPAPPPPPRPGNRGNRFSRRPRDRGKHYSARQPCKGYTHIDLDVHAVRPAAAVCTSTSPFYAYAYNTTY